MPVDERSETPRLKQNLQPNLRLNVPLNFVKEKKGRVAKQKKHARAQVYKSGEQKNTRAHYHFETNFFDEMFFENGSW